MSGVEKELFWLYSEAKEMYEEHLQKIDNKNTKETTNEFELKRQIRGETQTLVKLRAFLRV